MPQKNITMKSRLREKPLLYILLFSLLVITVSIAGFYFFQYVQKEEKQKAYNNLAALAKLKTNEVVKWRYEKISEAEFVYFNKRFGKLIYYFTINSNNNNVRNEIIDWIKPLFKGSDYYDAVIIKNPNNYSSLFSKEEVKLTEYEKNCYLHSVKGKKIILCNIHRNFKNQISMGSYIPLILPGSKKQEVFAVIVLRIDPTKDLYPLIQEMPIQSRTAETFIVHQENDSVVFLNDLKFKKNSALSFKLPLSLEDLPAAMVIKGMRGVFEGVDYKGDEVLAHLDKIPDSPWFIISKINMDEIYAPIMEAALYIFTGVLLLILLSGSIVFNAWKDEKIKLYDKQLKLEREKKDLFENMLEGYAYCQMIFDNDRPTDFIYLAVNEAFEKITGLKNIVGKKVTEVIPGIKESNPELFEIYGKVASTGKPKRFETFIDELKIWFSVSVYSPEKKYFVAIFDDITKRKQAEEVLRESQKDLNRAQAVSKTGSWKIDIQQNELTWSDETYHIFGIPQGTTLTYEAFLSTIHPDDKELVDQKWKAAFKGEPYDIVHRIILDGNIKWVHEKAELEFDKKGILVKGFGTVHDITERKRAEEAADAERKLLRTVIDLIPDFVYVKDRGSRFLLANDATANGMGFSDPAQLIGKSDAQVYPEKVAAEFRTDEERTLAGETIRHKEEIINGPDGKQRILLTTKVPLTDNNGAVVGLVGIGHEITKRKKAEENIRKLSSAIEQSPVSVVITDLDALIEYVNPKFSEVTGYSFEEVKGKNPRILKSGLTPHWAYKQLWEYLTKGDTWNGEFSNRKKNGEIYWEYASISPIKNESGVITNYVAVKEDITNRKLMEEKIEASLKEKETLLKEVHHRVKNNLQIISSLLSLQSSYIKNQESLEVLKESQNRVKSMALVHEKLYKTGDLSHINLGEYINDLAAKLFSSYGPNTKEIKFNLNIKEALIEMNLAISIGLILNELITNALKHAFVNKTDGKILVEFESDDKGNSVLTVSDDGIGIPQNFNFRQIDTLGLQIVKSLVDQHDGKIELCKGSGTRIKINFFAEDISP